MADALARQYQYYAYPLNVFDFESGDTISLTDDMALMETLFDCEEKVSANLTFNSFDFDLCFSIEYPVTVVDEAGKIYNAANEDIYYILLLSGKVANFVYPITLFTTVKR